MPVVSPQHPLGESQLFALDSRLRFELSIPKLRLPRARKAHIRCTSDAGTIADDGGEVASLDTSEAWAGDTIFLRESAPTLSVRAFNTRWGDQVSKNCRIKSQIWSTSSSRSPGKQGKLRVDSHQPSASRNGAPKADQGPSIVCNASAQ